MENIIYVPVGPIANNPAQMRRQYDLRKLAELTQQMLARGFDVDRPMLIRDVSGNGSPQYENIRGHRRRMAYLMSQELGSAEDLDEIEQAWREWVGRHNGNVEATAEALAEKHGDVQAPAVLFTGDAKQATLALWSDNYGDEEPDPLGIALSLLAGVKLGIDPHEAARHMGQARNWVDNHLALAQVDERVQAAVSRGELSISIAGELVALEPEQRSAVTQYILSMPAHTVTVALVRKLTRLLKNVRFEMPLTFPSPARRNIARAFINLWRSTNSDRAWLAACIVLSARSEFAPPWEDLTSIPEWLRALGVSFDGHWAAALEPYLEEVSCATCPVAQLNKDQSPAARPKLPCLNGHQVSRCMHGMAPDDPFYVQVPMEWNGETVRGRAGTHWVESLVDLQAAWDAQVLKEAANAVVLKSEKEQEQKKAEQKKAARERKKEKAKQSDKKPEPAQPSGPSPIDEMRARIGMYMTVAPTMAQHWMGTPCSGCQHKLDSSPTADPSVPHCAWASHNRSISFKQISGDGFGPIPICDQYAPDRPWREIVPDHPAPVQLPREWMEKQIVLLSANRKTNYDYKPFQWLTGRPMTSSENWSDWFETQFDEQRGELSDAQIFTLFVLVHDEWKRAASFGDDGVFYIPVDEKLAQLTPVKTEKWRMKHE